MANVVYPKALEGFATAAINFLTDNIKACAVDSGYVYSATDQFLTDLGAHVQGTSANLTGKSATNGDLVAANTSFPSPGAPFNQVVVYQDTGTAGTSRLITKLDCPTTTPNGNAIAVDWDAMGGICTL